MFSSLSHTYSDISRLSSPRGSRFNPFPLLGLFFLGGIGYFFYQQYQSLTTAPTLTVSLPVEGEVLTENIVQIEGQAGKNAEIFINREPISIDDEGYFSSQYIALQGGVEQFSIIARNRLSGEQTIIRRNVVLDPPSRFPGGSDQTSTLLASFSVPSTETQKNELSEAMEEAKQELTPIDTEPDDLTFRLRTVERAWIRVVQDKNQWEEFILLPGEERWFTVEQEIFIRSGKAYATYIQREGQPEEVLDTLTVAEKTYTKNNNGV